MINSNTIKAKKIIGSNFFMTIATASTGAQPWITPVYYAYDNKYTFYWYSGKETKHSKLIEKNSSVAIAIFNSSVSEEEAGGVYIMGNAYEVTADELYHALDVYFSRSLPDNPEERKQMIEASQDFLEDSVLRMYKVIPEKVYVSNDATKWNGKWIDSRSEIDILNK